MLILSQQKSLKSGLSILSISSDGKLYNPDHAHISPWSSTLFKVLWASSAFIKADRVVLGQTEKFSPMAGGWRKLRQEKQMIDWFGCVPDFVTVMPNSSWTPLAVSVGVS